MAIRNATDKLGRSVTIVPNDMARTLREASHVGWHEFVGMADGHSASFAPGTEVHTLVTAVFDHWTANGGFTSLVVGESGWDDAAAWWAPSPTHGGLDMRWHVGPMMTRNADGSVKFAG